MRWPYGSVNPSATTAIHTSFASAAAASSSAAAANRFIATIGASLARIMNVRLPTPYPRPHRSNCLPSPGSSRSRGERHRRAAGPVFDEQVLDHVQDVVALLARGPHE